MMSEKITAYVRFCPNCWGIIYDDRLKDSLVCKNCLENIDVDIDTQFENLPKWFYVFDKIKKWNLQEYKKFFDSFLDFKEFFYKITDKLPWSLQNSWTKRVFLKESFSIIAPTGVWKTTWWLVMWLYLYLKPIYKNKEKIYYILPTTLLAKHTYERFEDYLEKFCIFSGKCKKDVYEDILIYHGKLSNKQKKDIKERIKEWKFKILFTTTNFLYRNFDILKPNKGKFQFIFVDDVDSLLKTAKNIDYILSLMGFSDDAIQLALQIVKLKVQLPFLKWSRLEETLNTIQNLKNKLEKLKKWVDAILVASSATAKPKWLKIKILWELLNFEVWKSNTNLRNIEDTYVDLDNKSLNLVKSNFGEFLKLYESKFDKLINILNNWIFCFIPSDWWKEEVYNVKDYFLKKWIKCEVYENLKDETIEQFRKWDIKVLIGIASWRNPLARWIDLPDAAKYAMFLWVPKFVFDVNIAYNPRWLTSIILNLQKVLPDNIKEKIDWDKKITQYLKFLKKISNYTKEYILNNDFIKQRLEEIYWFVNNLITQEEIKNLLLNTDDISFDGQSFIVADIAAYLQASGRVSRMYVGWLTKWLSVVFVDNKKAFNNLQKRIKWFYDDLNFKKLEI